MSNRKAERWKPKDTIPSTCVPCPLCNGAGHIDRHHGPRRGNQHRASLQAKNIRAIMSLWNMGWSVRRIAQLYQLSKSHVHRIVQKHRPPAP